MKKKYVLFIALLFVCVLLVGCGIKNSIVGSWVSEESSTFVYTFNEDKTGSYSVGGFNMNFTYTIDGNKLSILYEGNTEPFETEFTLENNKLNVKDSFGEDTIYIRK